MLRILVTILFVLFSIFFAFVILVSALVEGHMGGVLIFLGLFIAGLMALHTILRLRSLFREFLVRHAAINAARKRPVWRVPPGDVAARRFLTYLRMENEAFGSLLKARPEALHVPGSLSGATGNHHFDAYVFDRRLPRSRSYMLLVREYAHMPTMDDLRRLRAEVADIRRKWKVTPSRVVLVVTRPGGNLDDDIYEALIGASRERKSPTLYQVAIEADDGTYDFIPIIPELRGFMP